jgi:hypothetical protein
MAGEHLGRLRGAWRPCGRSGPTVPASPAAPCDPELSLLRHEARVSACSRGRSPKSRKAAPDGATSCGGNCLMPSVLAPLEVKVAEPDARIKAVDRHVQSRYRMRGRLTLRPAHMTHHHQRLQHERWVD